MRDFQFQTPQRDQASVNRRLKSASEINKSQHKVTKKSLNPDFKAVLEENSAVLESPKEIYEVSDDNPFAESPENFIASVNPVDTHSSETVAASDLSSPALSSSSIITSDKHVDKIVLNAQEKILEVDSFKKIKCIEAEVVIKHLREARIQLLKSKDMGPSKKLLDALINVIIDEFYGGLYGEKEWFEKLLSKNASLVFLSFMMGTFAIFMFWIFNFRAKGLPTEPPPT